MNDEPKLLPEREAPAWDGFDRKRWANLYAAAFALLFGATTIRLLLEYDIGRNGRGQDVANVVGGIFVLVVVVVGLFLGRLLAWRLETTGRRVAMTLTLALGLLSLALAL